MKSWKDLIVNFAGSIEENFDELKYGLRRRLGYSQPLQIVAYRGYGSSNKKIFLSGRILEEKKISPTSENSSVWEHILNMYRRFDTNEVPFAEIKISFLNKEKIVQTNQEGFFSTEFDIGNFSLGQKAWHSAQIEILSPLSVTPATSQAEILIPPPTAKFAVISDIDDTVLWSSTTDMLKMFQLVFLKNVRARLPFKGIPALYRAFHLGVSGRDLNPIFYVSSSPWNLYDLLIEFLELYEIPAGPVLLRDMGLTRETIFRSHDEHKLAHILPILDTYPHLPFILLGDSSQRDPEIYSEIVKKYPDRILAIYIRDVTNNPLRNKAINNLIKEVAEAGSELVFANDSRFAAEHAASKGWIPTGILEEVREEKRADDESLSARTDHK